MTASKWMTEPAPNNTLVLRRGKQTCREAQKGEA